MARNGKEKKPAQNSGETTTRGKPFAPGVSGNPGGRPKLPADVKAWLTEHKSRLTVKALERLEEWIDSADEKASPAMIRVWLGKVIPEAALAVDLRTESPIPVSQQMDLSKLTLEQKKQLKEIYLASRGALVAGTTKP